MSRPRSDSDQRFPGESLEQTQMFVAGIAMVLLAVALMAKTFPADSGLARQVLRNYGASVFLVPSGACLALIVVQFTGKRVRWTRQVLLSRAIIWAVPMLWFGLLCFFEANQYARGHGDLLDFAAQALGWTITMAPLVWADRVDHRRSLTLAAIQTS